MTSRQVHRLHLSAPNEALVGRGAILVEDALNTASLPGSGGRLLVVRSLSLGKIRSNQSSSTVALAIEQRLRLLDSTAVYAEDPSSPWRSVVYFHNDAEPYILLALRLADGRNADAWFWPLAVPCFRRDISTDEALRTLILEAAKTQAGVATAAATVLALIERETAERLCESLRWQDGPALLKLTGCSMPEMPIAFLDAVSMDAGVAETGIAELPEHWLTVLDRWIRRWGAGDARSAWLAVVALIAEKPARALDRRLEDQAQQLITTITRRRASPATAPLNPSARREETNRVPSARHPALTDEILRAGAETDRPASTAMSDLNRSRPDEGTGLSSSRSRKSYVESSDTGKTQNPEPSLTGVLDYPDAPLCTRCAGIFFLLPVMSRLGISTQMECTPGLIECDLAPRLLLHALARFEIDPDDPLAQALSGMCSGEQPLLNGFVQPELWKQGIHNDGPLSLRRVEGWPGQRILFDGSGRLALALWRNAVPDAVRHFARETPVIRGAPIGRQDGIDLLLDSWLIAMRRWCRRYAGLGLRDLVCRPGRLSVTRTHVDALFDSRLADVRVRKAGLDLDPGWIPWFGRVVSFHYQYGEYADG